METWSRKEVKKKTLRAIIGQKWYQSIPLLWWELSNILPNDAGGTLRSISLWRGGFYVGMVRRIDRRSVRMFLVNEDADGTWLRTFH